MHDYLVEVLRDLYRILDSFEGINAEIIDKVHVVGLVFGVVIPSTLLALSFVVIMTLLILIPNHVLEHILIKQTLNAPLPTQSVRQLLVQSEVVELQVLYPRPHALQVLII